MAGGAAFGPAGSEGEWRCEAPLYGGAISCDVPSSFADVSQVREVPDHQEVFADGDSDRSLVVEILERRQELPDARDARLLSSRPALMAEELPHLPADVRCFVGLGEQTASKFGEACANQVRIHACVIRLAEQTTDILLTLNDPVAIDPQSSSGGLPVLRGSEELFARVLRSFRIVDWELFGS